MVDSAAAGALEQGGQGAGQDQGAGTGAGGGGEGGGASAPAWMTGLASEDLRGNAELARYGSIDDLAKGLVETQKWARGRVAIPSADDDAAWKDFGQKMRPEKAEDYDIPVPEGQDTAMADAFRSFAHETGMPPRWVKAIAEFNNQFQSDAISRHNQAGADGVKALELELGALGYNQRVEAVNNMMRGMGYAEGDMDFVKGLESNFGSEKTLRFLFSIAEKTGELGKVDSTDVSLRMGGLSAESAQGEIDRLMGDKDFMTKAGQRGSPESKKWADLNAAAAKRKK